MLLRRAPTRVALLLAASVLAACLSPAGLVGPVSIEGTLPPLGAHPAAAAARTGVSAGPLLLQDGRAWREGPAVRWEVTVTNPSRTTFDVTVVGVLLNGEGLPAASTVRELRLRGGDAAQVTGTIPDDPAAVDFRIEYWVVLLPPPERRIERDGS